MLCSRHNLQKVSRLLSRHISDGDLYKKLSGSRKPQESDSPKKTSLNTLAPCLDLIKQHDYEHYLCVCLAPLGTRRGLTALRAFNVELSRSAVTPYSSASDKEVNRLKLLWWRGVVEDLYQNRVTHNSPVVLELGALIRRHSLNKGFVMKLIEARLNPVTYNSLQDVEQNSENTHSALNFLTMEVLGYKTVETDHAASHLGRCEGHISLIRSIPLLASRGACLVPSTTLARTGVSQSDIVRGKQREKIRDVVHDIASSAHLHAEHCEELSVGLPPKALYGLLPLTPAKLFLKRLQKYDFDIFNERTLVRPPSLPFALMKESVKVDMKARIRRFQLTKDIMKKSGRQ